MAGSGKQVFASGATYEGGFRNSMFHGDGVYTWFLSGAKVISSNKGEEKKSSETLLKPAVYTGSWASNKMHGLGCYTSEDGSVFKGEFFNGKFDNGRGFVVLR